MKWVIAVMAVLLLSSCTVQPATLDEYHTQIDYSCTADAECVVKDVHNCCGYFPKCVNADATVDADLVQQLCADEELFGICGFEEIESCACVDQRCEATTTP
jgi:hypothetical protein